MKLVGFHMILMRRMKKHSDTQMTNKLRSSSLYKMCMLETYCFVIASEYHLYVQLKENTGQLVFENSLWALKAWTEK